MASSSAYFLTQFVPDLGLLQKGGFDFGEVFPRGEARVEKVSDVLIHVDRLVKDDDVAVIGRYIAMRVRLWS